ncbi:MAG TPA: hypothetical protein VF251_04135, partial [Pyrinomonadaceae bacterium]
ATNSGKNSFSGLFGAARSPEEFRRRFVDAPLDASVPAVLESALEMANVLTLLPEVFIASQKKELGRLQTSVGPNDSRLAAMQASIEQAEELSDTADKAQARVTRVATATAAGQKVFHGFVSAPDLSPLSGVSVRLTERAAGGAKGGATTDEDGYFSLPLERPDYTAATKTRNVSLSQQLNRLFETRRLETLDSSENATADSEKAATTRESTVQIFRKDKLIHEDPIPVDLGAGSIYREYIINEQAGSDDDFNEFVFGKAAKSETATDSTKKSPNK